MYQPTERDPSLQLFDAGRHRQWPDALSTITSDASTAAASTAASAAVWIALSAHAECRSWCAYTAADESAAAAW